MNLAFDIRVVSSVNRPQTCKPQPFCSHNELPNQRKTSVMTMSSRQADLIKEYEIQAMAK